MLDFYASAVVAAEDNGWDIIRARSIASSVFGGAEDAAAAIDAAARAWLEDNFAVLVCQEGVFVG